MANMPPSSYCVLLLRLCWAVRAVCTLHTAMETFLMYCLAFAPNLASVPMPHAWFFIQAVNGAISSLSISLAFVADLLAPQHRAACFGLIMASFSVGESCSQPAQLFV